MLHDELKNLHTYPFHMPGHKRNENFGITGSEIDITEIEGYDNLQNAHGTIAEVQDTYKKLYGSESAFLLVNGSTVGILAAVFAMTSCGDKVIIAANCHKSVYNACALRKLKTVIAQPQYDSENGIFTYLEEEEVNRVMRLHPDAKLLIYTSPTYEGYISEIEAKIPVIVDAAHGAHLPFFGRGHNYPKGSIVISSIHKTLPALTQTAVANIYDSKYIMPFRYYIDIFETSSPSYVLMNSASICAQFLKNGKENFEAFYSALTSFYKQTKPKHLQLMVSEDISKINISAARTGITGMELADILRKEYGFECEAAELRHVILMATVCDDFTVYKKLSRAIMEIDGRLTDCNKDVIPQRRYEDGEYCFSTDLNETEYAALENSVGRVCAEFVYLYPPGIPVILPNEVITEKHIHFITSLTAKGAEVTGTGKLLPRSILTKKE